jgi:hypothetical protein
MHCSAKIGTFMFKSLGPCISLLIVFAILSTSSAQKSPQAITGSAAKGAESTGMQVVPDLAARVAKFRRVEMPFHSAGLTARDVKLVDKLVDASRYI